MMTRIVMITTQLWLLATLQLALLPARAQTNSTEGSEFFEKKIRPILAERCFKCHSATSEKLKGGLHLDSLAGMLKGGDTGPVIVPGEPGKSLLIEAIRYGNVDLQMPPKGILPKDQIADFETWIHLGAPWPNAVAGMAAETEAPAKAAFDLRQRRKFWCWQPIHSSAPPVVHRTDWPANDVDRFVLAKLEEHHLSPAPDADARTLVRRLSFDLTGLPPSPELVAQFIADADPRAWDRLVDRFLASPQFGERWARHWLDLGRYAETMGHEFDYSIANAWEYRDYVIRAFNQDLPYDRFVMEQVAGDLLPPRIDPETHANEAFIGTTFLCLGQQSHSPVDVRQQQADTLDNQIDVLTKTFLGLTVACARCHDHKFDAITTRDYYSLYGIMESSRFALRPVDYGIEDHPEVSKLRNAKASLRSAVAQTWLSQLDQVETNLCVLEKCLVQAAGSGPKDDAALGVPRSRAANSAEGQSALVQYGQKGGVQGEAPSLHYSNGLSTNWVLAQNWLLARAATNAVQPDESNGLRAGDVVFADAAENGFRDWQKEGNALAGNPVVTGDFVPGNEVNPVREFPKAGALHSGLLSPKLEGAARSRTFIIGHNFVHLLALGRGSRVNMVVDNFTLIRDPIYGGLKRLLDREQPGWITFDLARWKGQRAYIEFEDIAQPDPADPTSHASGYPTDAFFSVCKVIFSDEARPPAEDRDVDALASLSALTAANGPATLRNQLEKVIREWDRGALHDIAPEPAAWALLQWLVREHLIESTPSAHAASGLRQAFDSAWSALRAAGQRIHSPRYVAVMAEGNGLDEAVFIRGSPRNPGPTVPRRFLEAIGGSEQARFAGGSGRLELARHLVAVENPLTARVMVNRIWSHLFGQGIVASPDNFGALGQAPTHPELLDWLAAGYRDHGWSTKKLVKLIVTSRAYRMSSQPAGEAIESADPGDHLLHRMRARRLEGEAIRDAILSVTSGLDSKLYGPSVPVALTPFMDGRGRPASSGPLDGDRRRSIYLEVRRNFLNPFMLTYDTPAPFSTVGHRTDSSLPAQALILLNDPFVAGQASAWARRVLSEPAAVPAARLRQMYLAAFGRPPGESEQTAALEFLAVQGAELGIAPEAGLQDEHLWADLAHVLLNVNEFVYIR